MKLRAWSVTEKKVLDMFDNPEFDKKRKKDTLKLLEIFTTLVKQNPTQRFSQILSNYGFVEQTTHGGAALGWIDEFHVEPGIVLKRVQEKIDGLKNT